MKFRAAFIRSLFLTGLAVTALYAQSSPLIMRHADNLNVSDKSSHLLLNGKVFFTHDSITFRTDRAVWDRGLDLVQCDGGFLFTHPSGFIKAQSGTYRKRIQVATAAGDVVAKDSAGSYAMFGQFLTYDRIKEYLTIPDKPVLHQYEKHKDGTVDTVSIKAQYMTYDKKNDFAQAFRNVVASQKGYTVTCDTGYFDKKHSWIALKGHPRCVMDGYILTGDSMYLVLDIEKRTLRSALVIRNAHGTQHEKGASGKPDQYTEAFGDTLYAEFKDDKPVKLYVNLNAHGLFYEDDLEAYKNTMDGNRLDLAFLQGKLSRAVVAGNAQSTYYYVKTDRTLSGKNESAGDTIHITFNDSKVKHLKLSGTSTLSSGRYFDLEKQHIQGKLKTAMADTSAAKRGSAASKSAAPAAGVKASGETQNRSGAKFFRKKGKAK